MRIRVKVNPPSTLVPFHADQIRSMYITSETRASKTKCSSKALRAKLDADRETERERTDGLTARASRGHTKRLYNKTSSLASRSHTTLKCTLKRCGLVLDIKCFARLAACSADVGLIGHRIDTKGMPGVRRPCDLLNRVSGQP